MRSEYWLKDKDEVEKSKLQQSWVVGEGDGFLRLKERIKADLLRKSTLPQAALENWESSVFRTAARCSNPTFSHPGNSSQVVVGRVQAGKTSSFTGLIRLLADNSYRIFIVVAGTSTNLRDQTFDRLSVDLSDSQDIEIVRTGQNFDARLEAQNLVNKMRRWTSTSKPNNFLKLNEKSIVYVALKSTKAHLDSLLDMLNIVGTTAEGDRLLGLTPTLLIDDEADQASPNGKASSKDIRDMTAVYKSVKRLREKFKCHSFVGYTATPYANVLMDLASEIRPEFVTMLDPGHDYTGAMELFWSDLDFAKQIDDFDNSEALPESLKGALAFFICQSIIFHCRDQELRSNFFLEPFLTNGRGGTVTMLVHADRLVKVSKSITQLLRELLQNWAVMFQSGKQNVRGVDLAEEHVWSTYFEPALEELESDSESELPRSSFRDSVREMLLEIEVLEIVGSGDDFPSDTPSDGKPHWKSRMAWVLVGGQLLDRGQTLPNLMTSYMPRSPGGGARTGEVGGQFDTLQQRGRFYGHRRTYRKLLRGWFSQNTLETYKQIAIAEQQHFDLLNELDQGSIGLADTQILFDKGNSLKLKLVRKNVLSDQVIEMKASFWVARQLWYSSVDEATQRALFEKFVSNIKFSKLSRGRSTLSELQNYGARVPAEDVLSFLKLWSFRESDMPSFDMACHLLANLVRDENLEEIEVVLMSRDQSAQKDLSAHSQYRSSSPFVMKSEIAATLQKIKQLPSSNDANYTDQEIPTLQIHFIDVIDQTSGQVQIPDAIGLALTSPSARPRVYRGALIEG